MGVKLGQSHWGKNVGWGCLRRIFRLKRDEVIWEWRKLHNEEPNDLYCSSNIVRVIKLKRMRWAGHVARKGGEERCIRGFGRETWGKRPLGRPRRRWEENIKVGLQESECEGMDWIELAQNRDRWWALTNAVMNLRVP